MSKIDNIILNGTQHDLGGSDSGLTEDIKEALLQLAAKVAYIDEHGQDYYGDLETALHPPAGLASISAVYTQSGVVYDSDSLDSLKTNLVVTAHFSDSTSSVVARYMLSGSLTVGTSIITISYGGKSTTFEVVVTHDDSADWDYVWRYGDGLPSVSDWEWVTSGGSGQVRTIVDDGMKLTAKNGTTATYKMIYAASEIAEGGGGVVESEFYIPSEFAVGKFVNCRFMAFLIGNGESGVRVEFSHKNGDNTDVLKIRLIQAGVDAYSGTLLGSWSYDTSYVLRLELDGSTGKVFLNGTLSLDNIDIATSGSVTSVAMIAMGGTVDGAGVGGIIQSFKVNYSPSNSEATQ